MRIGFLVHFFDFRNDRRPVGGFERLAEAAPRSGAGFRARFQLAQISLPLSKFHAFVGDNLGQDIGDGLEHSV